MKATKKLILAAISLVAASSLTVGSTFAWFSYRSNVELGEVEFGVDSGSENLQVAVVAYDKLNPVTPNDSDFAYSLKTDQIIEKINNGEKITYKPLTVKDFGANNYVADTNVIDLETEGHVAADESDYAVFDLIFRYTPVKADGGITAMPSLILNAGSVISAKDISNDEIGATTSNTIVAWEDFNETDYGVALQKGDSINARAKDAARVAFLIKDEDSSSGYVNKVWAPSEKFDSYSGSDPVKTGTNTSDSPSGFYLHNLANDYKSQSKDSVAHASSPAPTYQSRVYAGIPNPTEAEDFKYSAITKFPAVGEKGYSELRLTVKVWLEGKDGDCLESIVGDAFAFTLKFRTSTVVGGS